MAKSKAAKAPDDNTETLSARVTPEFKKKVARYAVDHDINIQDVIKNAVEEYMKRGA